MLGLKHNVNLLIDYDPRWEDAVLDEKTRITQALGIVVKGIEHCGSTAVPGMRAKPILDILVGVSPIGDWTKCEGPLEGLGYDYAANAGVSDHYIFGRGRNSTERMHLVHVVEFLGEQWRINIAVRDALRHDQVLRNKYVAEKERAAAASPDGRARYNELKKPFLDKLTADLSRARAERPLP